MPPRSSIISGCHRPHHQPLKQYGTVAAQLALDEPSIVHTFVLLEFSLLSVPAGEAFFQQAGPAFVAYGNGDHEAALAIFTVSTVFSGVDWKPAGAELDARLPGSVAQAIKRRPDTFSASSSPVSRDRQFGPEQAARIHCRCCRCSAVTPSRSGSTLADFLARHSRTSRNAPSMASVTSCTSIAEPVAPAMAEFLQRNSMAGN